MSRFQVIHSYFTTNTLETIQFRCNKQAKYKKNTFIKGMQKIKDFGELLLNYIPPKPKVVDKVVENFKKQN